MDKATVTLDSRMAAAGLAPAGARELELVEGGGILGAIIGAVYGPVRGVGAVAGAVLGSLIEDKLRSK